MVKTCWHNLIKDNHGAVVRNLCDGALVFSSQTDWIIHKYYVIHTSSSNS